MADLTTYAVLEHNFLFRELPRRTIEDVARLAHRRSLEAGAMIFSQGDEGDSLYGVASGHVRIFNADDKGHEVSLNMLGPGDTFGEIALLDGLPRTASAMAVEKSRLVVIPRAEFIKHLERDLGLAMHLMKLLCERLRWVSNLIEESSFLAGPARVARRLTVLVENYGRPIPGDGMELAISQAELGQFLGISRQIINQRLQAWSEQGWVETKRGRIVVRDIDAIRNLAEQS